MAKLPRPAPSEGAISAVLNHSPRGSLYWRAGLTGGATTRVTTYLHQGDLPADALAGASAVAIDSETMGLRLGRDPLCVVQLSDGNGDAHVVQLDRAAYDAPNLKRLLADPSVPATFQSKNPVPASEDCF